MKVAIVGSRTFTDYDLFEKTMKDIKISIADIIVSGGAEGADTMAEVYANVKDIYIQVIRPEWKKFGKSAGMIRNTKIIEQADLVVAFWDGKSKGTKDSIMKAKVLKKKLMVVNF